MLFYDMEYLLFMSREHEISAIITEFSARICDPIAKLNKHSLKFGVTLDKDQQKVCSHGAVRLRTPVEKNLPSYVKKKLSRRTNISSLVLKFLEVTSNRVCKKHLKVAAMLVLKKLS